MGSNYKVDSLTMAFIIVVKALMWMIVVAIPYNWVFLYLRVSFNTVLVWIVLTIVSFVTKVELNGNRVL